MTKAKAPIVSTPPVDSVDFAAASDEERQCQIEQAVRRHLPRNFIHCREESIGFRGRVDTYAIADLTLVDTAATTFAAQRLQRQSGDLTEDYICVMHVLKGEKIMRIADREYDLRAGSVLAFSSDSVNGVKVPDQMLKTQILIPRTGLQDLGVAWHPRDGIQLCSSSPAVRFLLSYLGLVRQTLSESSGTGQSIWAMRNAAVELTTAALYDVDCCPSSVSVRDAVYRAAQHYVHRHLSDPALSPAHAAAATHVSVRTLHRTFNERGEPFMDYVRRMRLGRARQDLLCMPRGETISAVANRWCFADASHFTRRFQELYGYLPKDIASHGDLGHTLR